MQDPTSRLKRQAYLSRGDDCDLETTHHGTCVAFCLGNQQQPTCPSGCQRTGVSSLILCFKTCDPLVQDCPDDDLCLPVNSTYTCVLDGSRDEGQLHDPCEYANACDKGLICLSPASSPQCDQGATGCCLPMCNIDDPNCPDADQSCFPVYEPQPPDFKNVGYCSVAP